MSELIENKIIEPIQVCYSYHIFQFPFKWKGKKSFGDLVSLLNSTESWEHKPFNINSILAYNEYQYFYPFIRETIYDSGIENEQVQCKHFERTISNKAQYEITLIDKTKDKTKTYALDIESITLDVYKLNAGILSFHLYNRDKAQASQIDILNINQFGRRLYPPFFITEKEEVATNKIFINNDYSNGLKKAKGIEIADQLALTGLLKDNNNIVEDFTSFTEPSNFNNGICQTSQILKEVLKPLVDNFTIEPLLDDRMFVICWYGNNEISINLKDQYQYKNDEWWFKYIYVDAGLATCQNTEMRNQFIENSTNARWADFGTYFGVTRYSFVLLTSDLETLKKPEINSEFLFNHIQTIYFQMTRLVLLQRALLLHFSDEINRVSKLEPEDGFIDEVDMLYKNYLMFINKIHFREITAQDQGIELYDLLLEKMCVNREVNYLSKEMQELHSYVNLIQQKQQNEESSTLTKIATIFLVPTLVISILSLVAGQHIDFQTSFELELFIFIFLLIGIALFSIFYVRKRPKSVMNWILKYFKK